MPDDKPKLDIDWMRTIAGALAAVSSAVLLSTLGAAGTIIGAALGSVTITLTSAFYAQGLATSRQRLARTQAAEAAAKRRGAEPVVVTATEDPDPLTVRERFALLPWKQIGVAAAGLFVIAVLAITAFELVVGRSVGSFTGGSDEQRGTTISKVTGGSSDGGRGRDRDRGRGEGSTSDPSPATPTGAPTSEAPAEDPTLGPAEPPSESPTPSDDPAPATPTDEPSDAPTEPEPTPSEFVEPEGAPTE